MGKQIESQINYGEFLNRFHPLPPENLAQLLEDAEEEHVLASIRMAAIGSIAAAAFTAISIAYNYFHLSE